MAYLKSNTGVELVTAHVLPDNKASSRCLIKNGFAYLLTKQKTGDMLFRPLRTCMPSTAEHRYSAFLQIRTQRGVKP